MRLIPNPTFSAEVKFTAPGGGFDVIRMTFKHKTPEALQAWLVANKSSSDVSGLSEVVESWEQGSVTDSAGKPIEFSMDALTLLLTSHGPRVQDLLYQYVKLLTESRVKN